MLKAISTFLFVGLLFPFVYGQNFSIGLFSNISIDHYRTNNLRPMAKIDEATIPTFSLGVMRKFKLKKSFMVETAISINQSRRKFSYFENFEKSSVIGSIGYTGYGLERNRKINFIAVPFRLGYQLNKWVFKLGARISGIYKVDDDKSSIKKYVSGLNDPIIGQPSKVDFKAVLEETIGIDYYLNETFCINTSVTSKLDNNYYNDLIPRFRYAIGISKFIK